MPQAKGLNCPSCGAAIELRALDHAVSVVCAQCLAVLDAKDPNLRILQQFKEKERETLLIPLGTRGKLHGDAYEAIGFQVRTIYVQDDAFSWAEYLLFNPYKGFRYLTEYRGHWNDVKPVKELPKRTDRSGSKPAVKLLGETYVHFQTATAETSFVMGEFPWQVRVGERVEVADFVSPPRILSSETSEGEAAWSLGEYMTGARVWEAFALPGSPPPAVGVFANQPSPYKGRVAGMWTWFLGLLTATATLLLLTLLLSGQQEVFRDSYRLAAGAASRPFTTRTFELKGRPSNVEMEIRTDLSNNWAYFQFALINEATGQAYNFGREVSYYRGRDSDGDWSEGSPGDTVIIPTVPAGRYYLLVEPQSATGTQSLSYDLRLRRDVPAFSFFLIAAALLVIPPVAATVRSVAFEHTRWQESDYAAATTDKDDDEEDDD